MRHHAYPLERIECQHRLANKPLANLGARYLIDRFQVGRIFVILLSLFKQDWLQIKPEYHHESTNPSPLPASCLATNVLSTMEVPRQYQNPKGIDQFLRVRSLLDCDPSCIKIYISHSARSRLVQREDG